VRERVCECVCVSECSMHVNIYIESVCERGGVFTYECSKPVSKLIRQCVCVRKSIFLHKCSVHLNK